MGRTDCTEPQCLYSTAIPLLPYGPYSLYRASVSVQYNYTSTPSMCRTACTEPQCLYSTAIPLLPLWSVRPLESLSACKIQLYLYSHYRPCGLYRASVPVQGCTFTFTSFTKKYERWKSYVCTSTWRFYRTIHVSCGRNNNRVVVYRWKTINIRNKKVEM